MTQPHPSHAAPSPATPADILDFWFGDGLALDRPSQDMNQRWFKGGPALDAEIKARFGERVQEAIEGGLAGWEAALDSRLALLILLDQFTRNVFRGDGRAFAGDHRAQQLVLGTIAQGEDTQLPLAGRLFLYMPLQHAEDAALQERSVASYTRLLADASPAQHPPLQASLDSARQHRDIVARFGRFPHRNKAMGRVSTPEEETFLVEGPRFGQ